MEGVILSDKIAVNFSDAANRLRRNDSGYIVDIPVLNPDDPATRSAMERLQVPVRDNIDVRTAEGIWIRNEHGAEAIGSFSREHKARFVFSFWGSEHAFGHNGFQGEEKKPFEQSLPVCLRKRGFPVVAVASVNDAYGKRIPEGINRVNGLWAYRISDFPDITYRHLTGAEGIYNSAETVWVDQWLESLGMAKYKVTPKVLDAFRPGWLAQRDAYLNEAKAIQENPSLG